MRHATTSMPTNVELGFAMTKVFFCTVHEQWGHSLWCGWGCLAKCARLAWCKWICVSIHSIHVFHLISYVWIQTEYLCVFLHGWF
jgi:hypothetical protein